MAASEDISRKAGRTSAGRMTPQTRWRSLWCAGCWIQSRAPENPCASPAPPCRQPPGWFCRSAPWSWWRCCRGCPWCVWWGSPGPGRSRPCGWRSAWGWRARWGVGSGGTAGSASARHSHSPSRCCCNIGAGIFCRSHLLRSEDGEETWRVSSGWCQCPKNDMS